MRLLHTSDWHLGMMFGNGITYNDDQKFFIESICKIAVEKKVDGIMIAGDVFDKSIASHEALKLYDETMTYICGVLEIPVYMIAGNHDGAERLASCNELLSRSGLHIAGALKEKPYVVNCGDVDIYMLPWITTDKVKTVYPEAAENIGSLEDAYRTVLDRYRDSFIAGHRNILISHAFIVNAETSVSDRSAEVGHAAMIGASVFHDFDYVALGHIHGPQQITENIRYSGSPMAYAFGKEEKQEKSVTIIDTDTMEQTIIPVTNLKKRTTLSGGYGKLLEANYPQDILDGYVRLEVTDSFVGLEALARLREVYKGLLEVSGKSLEKDLAKITMTIDELEECVTRPEEIFKRYCEDILEEAPSEHIMTLFKEALLDYEKEAMQ